MPESTLTTFATKEIVYGGREGLKIPVMLASGLNLAKGTVLGRITASGLYAAYDEGGDDGTEVASGILAHDVNSGSTGQDRPVDTAMYIEGFFYEDQLVGLDADAIDQLGAVSIPGRNILRI